MYQYNLAGPNLACHKRWDSVLLPGRNITVSRDGTTVSYEDLAAHVKPGELF